MFLKTELKEHGRLMKFSNRSMDVSQLQREWSNISVEMNKTFRTDGIKPKQIKSYEEVYLRISSFSGNNCRYEQLRLRIRSYDATSTTSSSSGSEANASSTTSKSGGNPRGKAIFQALNLKLKKASLLSQDNGGAPF